MQPPPSPRDLPDRILRRSLQHPANLRDFLRAVVPQLADGFVCERARLLDREFFLDDWRRREADLPFEIPYRTGVEELLALVYVLIEHQSDTDPFLPLRMLYSTVVYWDRQWREWEVLPRPKPTFGLRPVLPLVLYTGTTRWGSNRALSDMLGEPVAFHPFAPDWRLLFWNLADQTPEDLLQSEAGWLQFLAVMRALGGEEASLQAVLGEFPRRVDPLHDTDLIRWSDLMNAALRLVVQRRPQEERQRLLSTFVAACPTHQPEVQNMAKTIAEAWVEEGEARGVEKGRVEGARDLLRTQLEERFGALPEAFLQQLTAVTDLARLQQAARQVLHLQKLEDLQL
jgi:predicted transposase YdaD